MSRRYGMLRALSRKRRVLNRRTHTGKALTPAVYFCSFFAAGCSQMYAAEGPLQPTPVSV
jgi:hypothetical protein